MKKITMSAAKTTAGTSVKPSRGELSNPALSLMDTAPASSLSFLEAGELALLRLEKDNCLDRQAD
jgi:hypothetical protein